MMLFTILFPLLHSVLFPFADIARMYEQQETAHTATSTQTVWPDDTLKRICACESRGNPSVEPTHSAPDGTVLRGRINNKDVGVCQINLVYHQEAADRMGLDLFDERDNVAYATWLYRREGSKPWFWSRGCWGP